MILRLVRFYFLATVVVLAAMTIIVSQMDLQLGEKIGSGIFYVKGHYEKTDVVGGEPQTVEVTEQGIGFFVIPAMAGLVLTILYGLFLSVRSGRSSR